VYVKVYHADFTAGAASFGDSVDHCSLAPLHVFPRDLKRIAMLKPKLEKKGKDENGRVMCSGKIGGEGCNWKNVAA
jgi:hypothetical protein